MQFAYTLALFTDPSYCALHLIKNTERVKYCNPEYSDGEIDGLMKYFRFDTYLEFLEFMRKHKRD